jgi:hypothetical protein
MPATGWDYRNVYWWGADYFFLAPAGYGNDASWGGELFLQPGTPYPVGYRVADGSVGGAEPRQGALTRGDEQIKLQPPTEGNGPLKFISHCQIWVENPSKTEKGSFAFAIGVCDVSPGDMPMWPYIGVGHYLEMSSCPSQVISPGDTALAAMTRMDLMDERFMSSQPIPTWPIWTLRPNPDNNLWPGCTPTFQNRGDVDLKIKGFWGISYPTA